MEDIDATYDELRNLYLKEKTLDSLTRGLAIEKVVQKLLYDISEPLSASKETAMFNRRFDGLIHLPRGKNIIFEIKLGTLPEFELRRFMGYIYDQNTTKSLFLFIAYGISNKGKEFLEDLKEKGVSVSFIDFENLIALHKFVRNSGSFKVDNSWELKAKKQYFLEDLLGHSVINEPLFVKADSKAISCFEESRQSDLQIIETSSRREKAEIFLREEDYQRRLDKLEFLARSLLNEIQALKQQAEEEKHRGNKR